MAFNKKALLSAAAVFFSAFYVFSLETAQPSASSGFETNPPTPLADGDGKGEPPPPAPAFEFNTILPMRTLGSQTFQIDLGLMVPLFSYTTEAQQSNGPSNFTPGANLTLGGVGAIKWSAFLNQTFALGVDVGGSFMFGPNDDAFGQILVGPRASAVLRAGVFDIPISLTPGVSILSYKNLSYVGFGLKPSVGFYWNATPDWAFGLNVAYWWMPEVYTGATPAPYESRVGNFLEITLSALYSF